MHFHFSCFLPFYLFEIPIMHNRPYWGIIMIIAIFCCCCCKKTKTMINSPGSFDSPVCAYFRHCYHHHLTWFLYFWSCHFYTKHSIEKSSFDFSSQKYCHLLLILLINLYPSLNGNRCKRCNFVITFFQHWKHWSFWMNLPDNFSIDTLFVLFLLF